MLLHDLFEASTRGTFSPEQARDIGSCAIIAVSNLTGRTWNEVWEVAKPFFGRNGLTPIQTSQIFTQLGYRLDGYYKMPWCHPHIRPGGMTVNQSAVWLRENDPDVHLYASIHAQRQGHAISFRDGDWHNTLGANRAKLRLVYRVVPR
jgi:hypothetical protein